MIEVAKDSSLKSRIIRSSAICVHNPLMPSRPKEYKKWDEMQLQKACQDAFEGQAIRRALNYGIPKSTLHDKISGRATIGAKSGPAPYLSPDEEDELVSFLSGCSLMGYARTKKQTIALVQRVVDSKEINVTVGDGWWKSFMKRHGTLTLRTAEPLSYAHAVCSQPEILNHYYDLLQQTLIEHDLADKPNQIFNLDESGMPLDPCPPKVITHKGVKHSTSITTGDKAQITTLACCSAAGYVIPPLVVFDRKNLKPEMTVGEVPGTMYGLSSNGWMDTELFELWFKHHFLTHVPSCRPILLMMDGHSTHFQPSVVRMAAKEDVILFCLPPHSTHLTQPLDKGCFGPLKSAWKQVCHEYLTRNPGKVVTRYQFSELFGKAWTCSMSMTNIIAGFRTTGIFPFNRNALLPVVGSETPSKFNPKSLCEGTKLKFIPVYTPAQGKSVPPSSSLLYNFTEEEVALFTKRYEEGYDLTHDKRYNYWVHLKGDKDVSLESGINGNEKKIVCTKESVSPKESVSTKDSLLLKSAIVSKDVSKESGIDDTKKNNATRKEPALLKHSTVLSKVLSSQDLAVVKIATKPPKTSARVLTSSENLKILEEKEKKKQEEADMKRKCKIEAEKRREEREKVKGDKEKRKKKGSLCTFCIEI